MAKEILQSKALAPRLQRKCFPGAAGGNFGTARGKCEFYRSVNAGEENLDVFGAKIAADGSNPARAVLVMASGDDNHLRLQLSKNVQVGRLEVRRQTEADEVRPQIRLPIEEFFLTAAI